MLCLRLTRNMWADIRSQNGSAILAQACVISVRFEKRFVILHSLFLRHVRIFAAVPCGRKPRCWWVGWTERKVLLCLPSSVMCPRSRLWKQRHWQWTYHGKKRVELYMCKYCQETGQGCNPGSDYRKVSLQLIIDEPPEALYNQWILMIRRARLIYDQLQASVAPAQDEHLDVGPLSHSSDRGAAGQLIWRSILSSHELANLQYLAIHSMLQIGFHVSQDQIRTQFMTHAWQV